MAVCSLSLIRIKEGHHLTFVCMSTLEPLILLKYTWDRERHYHKIRYNKGLLFSFSQVRMCYSHCLISTLSFMILPFTNLLRLLKECRVWLTVIQLVWNLYQLLSIMLLPSVTTCRSFCTQGILVHHIEVFLITLEHVVIHHLDINWFNLLHTTTPICICPESCTFIEDIFTKKRNFLNYFNTTGNQFNMFPKLFVQG